MDSEWKRRKTGLERRLAEEFMSRARGNLSEAARTAGLSRSAFQHILARCGIDRKKIRTRQKTLDTKPPAIAGT